MGEDIEQAGKTALPPQHAPPKPQYASSLELKIEPKVEPETPEQDRPRKRRDDGDGDGDGDGEGNGDEHRPGRARLTRENLTLFNKMAKRNNSKASTSVSATPDSTVDSSTTETKSILPTSSGFADQAYKNGILLPLHSKAPTNLEDIRERLDRPRGTPSPPESAYEDYIYRAEVAPNESTMVGDVLTLLKPITGRGYHKVLNQPFSGLPKNIGFNNGLSAPQPDFVEGPEKREFRPFPVEERIRGAVLYKDDPYSLTLPHLAEADPLGHAEVLTFTTDGASLNIFAHYATPSEDSNGMLEYHQYPIKSTNLFGSYQGFKDGRRWLRNGQDHAREQSYALRDQLRDNWKQHRRAPDPPVAEGAPLPAPDGISAEINEREVDDGYQVIGKPCQPNPAASSQPQRGASSSIVSSKSVPPTDDYIPGSGGQKRKDSSPQQEPSRQEASKRRG
ncbi:hypothetical protein B0T19DRAFT_442068 [Cercophora scortea]|uniref:Uncharacterized protein n=1 Tax=Cercophora scortea TaxID=314031 RepID=A0AAE0INR3_9PEZI|nr:hypothetical protein B0T19DRAFT_442068 [Cercophora scortea]